MVAWCEERVHVRLACKGSVVEESKTLRPFWFSRICILDHSLLLQLMSIVCGSSLEARTLQWWDAVRAAFRRAFKASLEVSGFDLTGFCDIYLSYRCSFTLQEAYGRYLDLHALYNQFLNSKFGQPTEYSTFLDEFSQTHKIARGVKLSKWVIVFLCFVPHCLAALAWFHGLDVLRYFKSNLIYIDLGLCFCQNVCKDVLPDQSLRNLNE